MAVFQAVANAGKGINSASFSLAYAKSLLVPKFYWQFLPGFYGPYYRQVYQPGRTGDPFPNAFTAILQLDGHWVEGFALGGQQFSIDFDLSVPKAPRLKAEGTINAFQMALGPSVKSRSNAPPAEWWTLYGIELDASEFQAIANDFLAEKISKDKDVKKAAEARATDRLRELYEGAFAGKDQIFLTNYDDVFYSFADDDTIRARRGADQIHPGLGNDLVYCGSQSGDPLTDPFGVEETDVPDGSPDIIFLVDSLKPGESELEPGRWGVDDIRQFGLEDRIVVSSGALKLGISFTQKDIKNIKKNVFKSATSFGMVAYDEGLSTNQTRFFYNASTGVLSFDRDGNGFDPPVQIAVLSRDAGGLTHPVFSPSGPLPLFISL